MPLTGRNFCASCLAGTFAPSTGSSACGLCSPGTYQPEEGRPDCLACPPGTYRNYVGGTVCDTCSAENACPVGFVSFPCVPYENAQCEQCPAPYTNRGPGDNNCNSCVAGYYVIDRGQFISCIPCTRTDLVCGSGQFISCPAYSTSWCANCTGLASFCGAGQQPSKYCESGTDRVDSACVDCPAGTEKNSALVRDCVACGVGYYKELASNAPCATCTNKYPTNSVYVGWNISAATTSACPWTCNAGHYRSGDGCLSCASIAGKFSAAQGQTVCSQCTNAPPNSMYAAVGSIFDGRSNNCPWVCNSGYAMQGSTCAACGAGNFSGFKTEGLFTFRVCTPCQTCAAGTYESGACVSQSDRVCSACAYQCSPGQYIASQCNATAAIQCSPCDTRCPKGKYLSGAQCSGQTTSDTVLAACQTCIGPEACQAGIQYLPSNCSGTERGPNTCAFCSVPACSFDTYRAGCGGYWDTQCVGYRACAAGWFLSGKQQDRDGVCQRCRNCTLDGLPTILACSRYEDTICGGVVCNRTRPCNSSADSHFYCDYTQSPSVCGRCPNGYGADGQFCLECPRGKTCSRRGDVVCKGQCDAGRVSVCGSGFLAGYVSCAGTCAVPASAGYTVNRGTHERPENGDCRTYIECSVGYYTRFRTNGQVRCELCNDQARPAYALWMTEGLSVNDDTSCLWECRKDISASNASRSGCVLLANRGTIPDNTAGWHGRQGSGLHQTCGAGRGKTSEAGTALVAEECLDCPAYPVLAGWTSGGVECEWYCLAGVRRGGVCSIVQTDCRARGYSSTDAGQCVRAALPWSHAGRRRTGVTVEVRPGANTTAPWLGLQASSTPHGVKGRHRVGNRTVDGPLCSMVSAWVGGREFMFGSVCSTSFLVYLNLSDPNARLGVLIGSPGVRGWRDGFRTEALFQDDLYVARGVENRTLFVLDRWNCVLREVSIADTPGGYLTRAYTVYGLTDKFASTGLARCYGAGSLASPRKFWGLGVERAMFSDDNGLWQLELATREVVLAMSETAEQFEADDLTDVSAPDVFALVLAFGSGAAWVVRAAVEACPDETTSLDGGDCTTPCVWKSQTGGPGQFVNQSSGACVACVTLACGVGRFWVPCSRTGPGYCDSCPGVLGVGRAYVKAGDCSEQRFVPPCPVGFYTANQGWCEQCPRFSTTVRSGAVYLEQCKCVAGFVRRGGACVTDDPLYVFEPACAGNCTAPGNASLVAVRDGHGKACSWACDAGFYRDRLAAWPDQCRPCAGSGVALSRGDDDSPLSCEFA